MVLINKAINEVTVKLVYYGPGLCGKTTNLEQIYSSPRLENKGKMISMATETDRTLFFDFMPLELGTIGGQKIRVQIYTVPGQVFYDATRKLVLRGADGVVFVADSQQSMRDSNIESLQNLETNLRLNRIDPRKIAMVFQYNKRDLPGVSPVEEMNGYFHPGTAPVLEAVAIKGQGVTQTLRAAISRILDNLKNNVDVTLYEAPPLQRPVMGAASGATPTSAGVPKVSVSSVPLPRVNPAPPAFVAPQPLVVEEEPREVDFADLSESVAEEPETEPTPLQEDAPFAVSSEAPREEPPFAVSAEELREAEVEAPFEQAAHSSSGDALHEPFGSMLAEAPAPAELQALLDSAERLIVSLETALSEARRHRDEILQRLGGRPK